MKHLYWILLTGFFSTSILASDSTWLLCKNSIHPDPHDDFVPVVNIYEHRNGATSRKTEIYLVSGIHLMTDSLLNTNEGKVKLAYPCRTKKEDSFTGIIKIDYIKNILQLKGDYIVATDGSHHTYDLALTCEGMN
ncbi:MAG: hypothetical protein Q7U04_00180 [Bacteriovorax sp.]|nr:hypothetical protein [Bacteriovorax sp.]